MDEINVIEERGVKDEVTGQPAPLADNKPVILEIPVEKLQPNEFWLRSDSQEDLDSLSESIDAHGLQQFPAVREKGDGSYTIVSGHRRFLAYKESARKTIPCRILDVTEKEAAFLLVIDNLHRRQLRPLDEARTIRLIADKFQLTDIEVARHINWKANVLNERLAVLRLPEEIQQKIGDDAKCAFKFTHAVTLSRLWDEDRSDRQLQVRKLFEKTILHKLSTTELKDLVSVFQKGDFDHLPDRLRTPLLSNRWMTAAMAQLYLSPHGAIGGQDRRAKGLRAAARKLDKRELEGLIAEAVRAEWTYEKTVQKLLKRLERRQDPGDPNGPAPESGVDRLLACVSAVDHQLAASRDEIEGRVRSNPKELGAVWHAIVQLQKKLQAMATLMDEAINGASGAVDVPAEETANVTAG